MIEYLIGVDGGGTGTRVRLANVDGDALAQARSGPSGLALGIDRAWCSINEAVAGAFAQIGLDVPLSSSAIGLGLAGVHNREWAAQFEQANPGYAQLRLDNDGYTTLLGAHQGAPGVIIALGTGSVGQALLADGTLREVGGWGFPSGDEASGGWIGLRAINHIQQVLDGRRPNSAFAQAVIDACGGSRDAIQIWLGSASQTAFAALAPIVLQFAPEDAHARAFLEAAGQEVARMAAALDPSATLPLALCGGLGAPLRPYLPATLHTGLPQGDAASGALRMIAQHTREMNDARTA